MFAVAAGVSVCRLCGAANGSAEQTDGEHFVWPKGLAHYVEEHGGRLPDEVVAIAARGVAPVVDLEWFMPALVETGGVTIDVEWWHHLAGPGSAGHAFGMADILPARNTSSQVRSQPNRGQSQLLEAGVALEAHRDEQRRPWRSIAVPCAADG